MLHYEKLISLVSKKMPEYDWIKEARPFILPRSFKDTAEKFLWDEDQKTIHYWLPETYEGSEVLKNPLPFKACCFETTGSLGKSFLKFISDERIFLINVLCVAALEKTPTDIEIIFLYERNNDYFFEIVKTDLNNNLAWSWRSVVRTFCNDIYKSSMVLENCRYKFKVGVGKNKEHITIRNIVHVYPKTERPESLDPVAGGKIDYSHRFEVRGHWRKCEYIGKDREGNYCMNGHTWVVPHVKGPENLPLIKKTRVLDKSFNQELRA